MVKPISILCLVAGLAAPAGASVIANSITDFSGTQGQSGWYYGYYDLDNNLAGFQLMEEFDGQRWWTDSTRYWTMIGPIGAHSNGHITSGFALPVEQWAARRWVSNFDGLVDINADLCKLNINPDSNGVTGRIYIDGTEVWQQFISATDDMGASPQFQFSVTVGTAIDFVLDPTDSNDWADNTRFSAVISTVPAPATACLLGLGGLVALRRRRLI